MSVNRESQLSNLDELLSDFEKLTTPNTLFSQIDHLCNLVEQGFDGRKGEIVNWSSDIKRKEAVESQDTLVLGLLAVDENFNVRTLVACNPNTPEAGLRRLVEASDDYTKLVIANNPSCPSDILQRIIELTDTPQVLDAVKFHPNSSAVTKFMLDNKR